MFCDTSWIYTYRLAQKAPASGDIIFTGAGGIVVTTGLVGSQIIISGWDTGQYVISSMTGQFVDSSQTGQYITTAQTGQFAPSGMTGQFITTAQTGQFAPSGMTGQFVTTNKTGQFAPSGMTGQFVTTNKTGQFAPAGMTGQFVTTNKTGGFVSISQTGQFVDTAMTGVLLARGETGIFYPASNPAGYITSAGAAGIGSINITGQLVSGQIQMTGIGGIALTVSGTTIVFSGSSSSGSVGAYVDLVSNQTISGVKTFVSDIRVSGIRVGISVFNTGTNSSLLATGNSNDFYQINNINVSSDSLASADLVASNSTSNTSNYVNLGINGPNYTGAFVGNSGDSYCFGQGGDVYVGNITSGKYLVLFAKEAGNIITGVPNGNIIIDTSGRVGIGKIPSYSLDVSGSGVFSDSVSVGSSLVLSAVTGAPNKQRTLSDYEVFASTFAGKTILYGNNGYDVAPIAYASWSKYMGAIVPGTGPAQLAFGVSATSQNSTSAITHINDIRFGLQSNHALNATPGAVAGPSTTSLVALRGANTLVSGNFNGFFFVSYFGFPDATGTYITGGSPNRNQSGVRFFAGMTDQLLLTHVNSNVPTGSRAGVSFIRSTGGSQGPQANRVDTNFQFTTADNQTETLQNTNMPWNSGEYGFYMYMPPSPNTSTVFWRLEDRTRGTFVTGLQTATLPVVGTPMRAICGIETISGAKNLRTTILYFEV